VSYSANSNWGVSRAFFESVTLGVFAAMILIALLFWAAGAASRRHGFTGEAEFVADGARRPADPPG
jgi:hypothetical protein